MSLFLTLALLFQPAFIKDVTSRWADTGVEVDAVAASCGYENAFYVPDMRLIVVCRELVEADEANARFVLNHELGHAWMFQHGVPNSERGADELAVLMSTKAEALANAHWLMRLAKEEGADAGDDDGQHQTHADRAASVFCLTYGLYEPDKTTPVCRMYAESLREQWTRLGFPVPE
jgi:hypothetical protein